MQIKQLKDTVDLELYAANYLQITSVIIPPPYLQNNLVYGFYRNFELVAGFVIGINPPFRTIELFAPSKNHALIMDFLNSGEAVCEVCCFWKSKELSELSANAFIWFCMSQRIRVEGKKFFLGGTNARSLANLYGYPSFAHLISSGKVDNKQCWIFIAWRRYSVLSAIQVMLYKMQKFYFKFFKKKPNNNIKSHLNALIKIEKVLYSSTGTAIKIHNKLLP